MSRVALFEGLIFDEEGQAVDVAFVGGEAHYVVSDQGFLRHIPAEQIDRYVLEQLRLPLLAQREEVVEGLLQWMGQEDLFTKAMVEHSLDKMDETIERLLQVGLPEENRTMLGMIGFRIIVNVHGEVTDVVLPAEPPV